MLHCPTSPVCGSTITIPKASLLRDSGRRGALSQSTHVAVTAWSPLWECPCAGSPAWMARTQTEAALTCMKCLLGSPEQSTGVSAGLPDTVLIPDVQQGTGQNRGGKHTRGQRLESLRQAPGLHKPLTLQRGCRVVTAAHLHAASLGCRRSSHLQDTQYRLRRQESRGCALSSPAHNTPKSSPRLTHVRVPTACMVRCVHTV